MTPRVKVNSAALNKAIGEMLKGSKRKLEVVMREQAKMLIKEIVLHTPPHSYGVGTQKAFVSGKQKVESNLRAIMQGINARGEARAKKQGEPVRTDLAAIDKSWRNKNDRRAAVPIKVPAKLLKAYITKMQERVGLLASGWGKAAAEFGYTMPKFISRHRATGSGKVTIARGGTIIRVTLHNWMRYSARVKGIIGYALGSRVGAVWRREAKARGARAIKEAAKESGFAK